jgi:hypothetical protein
MASTYSDRLRIELIGTGDQSGTWGITTNTNLGTILEEAIAGLASITMSDANYTLSVVDGGSDEARQMMIWLSGTLSATRDVICPAEEKLYFVKNGTSGGQSIVFKTSAGTGITIPNGQTAVVICDGTNVVDGITYIPSLGSAWIKNTGAGNTSFNGSQNGLALTATGMDTTNKYTPSVKFGSTDTAFSTTNPKFGAAIVGEATEAYAADTDGGMALTFWTSPDDPGTGSGLVQNMRLTQWGTLGIGFWSENVGVYNNAPTGGSTSQYGFYANPLFTYDGSPLGLVGYQTALTTPSNGGSPYTVNSIVHFGAAQGVLSGDSTVTNQYGFFLSSALSGGTFNTGYYSGLASSGSSIAATSVVRATNITTVTTASAHGIVANDRIIISGVVPASFNGVYTVASAGSTTLTYTQTGLPDVSATTTGYLTKANDIAVFADGTAPSLFDGPVYIQTNTGMDALRIQQSGVGPSIVVADQANDLTPFIVTASGLVGMGTPSPLDQLEVVGIVKASTSLYVGDTANTNYSGGILNLSNTTKSITLTADPTNTGASSVINFAVDATVVGQFNTAGFGIGGGASANIGFYNRFPITGGTTAYANYTAVDIKSDVTGSAIGYRTFLSVDPGFTLTNLQHYRATQGTIGAGSAITNQYGFFSDTTLVGATTNIQFYAGNSAAITSGKTNYAFYSDNAIATGGGTTWNFYANGTAPNYFAGNVGIGTTIPLYKLDIYNASNVASRLYGDDDVTSVISRASTDGSGAAQVFYKYRGTHTSPTGVSSGDITGRVIFYGYDGSTLRVGAEIRSSVDGTPGSGDMPGRLDFYTTPDGTATQQPRLSIKNDGYVGIGATSPAYKLDVRNTGSDVVASLTNTGTAASDDCFLLLTTSGTGGTSQISGFFFGDGDSSSVGQLRYNHGDDSMTFYTSSALRGRWSGSGDFIVGDTTLSPGDLITTTSQTGIGLDQDSYLTVTRASQTPVYINRITNDGLLIDFRQAGVSEGSVSVSGTTVSYNGGHLARWSQLPNGQRDPNLLKGTVLTNLNEMCEWTNPDGQPAENEQLNRMKISDVEGDPNVAGVFVNWDDDDQDNPYDMNIAMTGDMVIRIAQGVTVQRGDLLMSAGDGTAKPQGDDIVRSKTIAKVTSTHVSCTYEDGSYCVPCVLMAC